RRDDADAIDCASLCAESGSALLAAAVRAGLTPALVHELASTRRRNLASMSVVVARCGHPSMRCERKHQFFAARLRVGSEHNQQGLVHAHPNAALQVWIQ